MNAIRSNLHTHTTFSDGKNTPAEMIERAKELGFVSLGFSDHSETVFDPHYCMASEKYSLYRRKISELKEKEEKIELFCGLEKDYFSSVSPEDYDYTIGSVHYLYCGGEYYPMDHSLAFQKKFLEDWGRGDPLELAKRYYDLVAEHAAKSSFEIQGHFDLIAKFGLYDQPSEEYCRIAIEALDAVLETVPYVEVNTGAISRGYRKEPYPDRFLLDHLYQKGAKLILGSDCHRADAMDCHFEECLSLLKSIGFSSVWQKRIHGFEIIYI